MDEIINRLEKIEKILKSIRIEQSSNIGLLYLWGAMFTYGILNWKSAGFWDSLIKLLLWPITLGTIIKELL